MQDPRKRGFGQQMQGTSAGGVILILEENGITTSNSRGLMAVSEPCHGLLNLSLWCSTYQYEPAVGCKRG